MTRRGRCASGGRGEGDDQRGRAVGEGRSRWRAGRTGGGERESLGPRELSAGEQACWAGRGEENWAAGVGRAGRWSGLLSFGLSCFGFASLFLF